MANMQQSCDIFTDWMEVCGIYNCEPFLNSFPWSAAPFKRMVHKVSFPVVLEHAPLTL